MPLSSLHEHFRQTVFEDIPYPKFIAAVCNRFIALPEDKIEGNPMHMPISRIDTHPDSLHYDAETRADQYKAIRGWKAGYKYLLVLPNPNQVDVEYGLPLSHGTQDGDLIRKQLAQAGISPADCLVTYAIRFAKPSHMKSYSTKHKRSCEDYVKADAKMTRPKVIITFGADALKCLLGQDMRLDAVRGNVLDFEGIPVIPSCSPAMFATDYGDLGVFQSEFRRAYEVVEGLYNPKRAKEDYTVATTLEEVKALLERIRLDSPKRIAMDTEWGNDVARDEFRYTLSIQLAWSKGKAGFIQLRKHEERNKYYREEEYGKANKAGIKKTRSVLVDPGPLCGVRIYSKEDEQQVWNLVADLLRTPAIQLCGHHLRVDVEEFNRNGANIDEKLIDGFDTMLVHNVLYGDDSQGLDHLTRKYCPDYGAYWSELEAWLSSTGKRNYHLQFGYRDITLDILTKYGLLDADITWQVAEVLDKELEASPALKSYYYTIAAPTSLHLLDVERQGLLIDEQRRMEIREEYIPVYESLLADIRKMINWPDFSPSSKVQLAYLLFGESVKYKDWAKAALNCPKDVKLLKLTPLQNTDKYPRPWDDIVANGEEHLHTPSTKSNVLDILANTHKDIVEVKVLKHLSVIGKLISTYLVPITLNEFGVPQDGAGLHNNIRSDGRAITKLSQITETGRYTSSKANLQTWPKKQETAVIEALVWQKFKLDLKDYKAKCSSNEIPESDRIQAVKFKSIVIAPPGHSLIEVDFKNAELFLWAYCSGDKKLIDICTSGRDMHSEGTVSAFKITHLADELVIALEKLKKGDKEAYNAWSDKVKANYEALRTSYKAIIFGVIYGRGAPAVARELNKSGVNVSVADCEKIISNISDSYPVGWAWLQTNMDHAIEHGWVEIPGGRRRYFTGSKSLPRHIQSAIRREASNFGPQGEVALLLSKAGINFYNHRYKTDEGKAITYKLLLPIHDAFLIEVKDEHVTEMKRIIKECMSTNNKIPGTNYNLDVDIEVFKRWGEKEKK